MLLQLICRQIEHSNSSPVAIQIAPNLLTFDAPAPVLLLCFCMECFCRMHLAYETCEFTYSCFQATGAKRKAPSSDATEPDRIHQLIRTKYSEEGLALVSTWLWRPKADWQHRTVWSFELHDAMLLLFCKFRRRTVDKSASAKITAPLEKRRHKKYLTARNLEQMFIFCWEAKNNWSEVEK